MTAPAIRPTAAEIDAALRAALAPRQLAVIDESHLHAGHAGAAEGSHFRVQIQAECFTGKTRVAQHRLVYDALASLIPRGIHALAIDVQAVVADPAQAPRVADLDAVPDPHRSPSPAR